MSNTAAVVELLESDKELREITFNSEINSNDSRMKILVLDNPEFEKGVTIEIEILKEADRRKLKMSDVSYRIHDILSPSLDFILGSPIEDSENGYRLVFGIM